MYNVVFLYNNKFWLIHGVSISPHDVNIWVRDSGGKDIVCFHSISSITPVGYCYAVENIKLS